MKIEEIVGLVIGLISSVWLLFAFLSLFFKRKVIIEEQTLKDGTKQYEIMKNWFLGLPFLWDPVWKSKLDEYCDIEPIFPTLKEAEDWLEKKRQEEIKEKQCIDNSKVISKRRVYERKG